MDIRERANQVRKALQEWWTEEIPNDAYGEVIIPLYKLLAELIDPDTEFEHGAIDHQQRQVTALLLTPDHVYYAAFELQERLDSELQVAAGYELADGYNLQIMPRSSLKAITVNTIADDRRGYSDSITGATYTAHYSALSFNLPIGRKYRHADVALPLLRALHNDLQK